MHFWKSSSSKNVNAPAASSDDHEAWRRDAAAWCIQNAYVEMRMRGLIRKRHRRSLPALFRIFVTQLIFVLMFWALNLVVLTYPHAYERMPLGEGTASLLLPVLQMMCIVGMDFFNRPVNHGLAQPCTHLARCVVQLFKLYLFGSAKTAQALIVMICVNLGTWAYQVRARKGDGVVVYDAWCGGGTYFFVPFTIIGCQVSTCTTGAPVGWQRITRTHGYMPFPF
jgi:hypothetical protein